MTYEATILADSFVKHTEARLTTFKITFPRFILAELNTHRMLSRNSASSRAIPPEKLIARVKANPFVPETFNARVKGMGVGTVLDTNSQIASQKAWLFARDKSVLAAEVLMDIGVDKSRINRLLEPFLWHTALVSATDWSNFFALRDHPDAQPEFQIIARMMREAMEESSPRELVPGQWHLPLIAASEREMVAAPMISAGRCFRVSYDIVTSDENVADSIDRAERGKDSGHWSPLEHPAVALNDAVYEGNFCGFKQLRKFFAGESDFSVLREAESVEL